MDNPKDKVAIAELEVVIHQLEKMLESARENLGRMRPLVYSGDIELVKDHLDLVAKYMKL